MDKFLPLSALDSFLMNGNKERALRAASFMAKSEAYPDSLKERLNLFCESHWRTTLESIPIIIVLHDLEVGGAQDLMLAFAEWLQARTQYSPVFVALRTGGNYERYFYSYPLLVLDCAPENIAANQRLVSSFIERHKPVLGILNSVASGGVCDYLSEQPAIPWFAYIHELNTLLTTYQDNLVKLNQICSAFIAGSAPVAFALHENSRCSLPIYTCEAFIDWQNIWHDPPLSALFTSSIQSHRPAKSFPNQNTFQIIGCGTLHWRKDPFLFIDTALYLLHYYESDQPYRLEFIWYGGGPDLEACKQRVEASPFPDRIIFAGHSDHLKEDFSKADLLLLCSIEDPFPLTAIQAGALGLPIVTIEGTGGIADLLKSNSLPVARTRAVQDLTELILPFLMNIEFYADISVRTQKLFARKFTSLTQARQLFLLLKKLVGQAPLVSVILPNYNCAQFLEKRLFTILFQTFQDFEIIVLDDSSSDASRDLLFDLMKYNRQDKLIFNDVNSGSVFHQWKLGIEAAKGHYVWIAESDDFVDLHFLDLVLSSLSNNNTSFAYCNSVPVSATGEPYGDYRDLYLNQFNLGKWDANYSQDGIHEIESSLGIANTIPNASSAIFKRDLLSSDDLNRAIAFKMCGDWFVYALLCSRSHISFVRDCNNYHTRHAASSSFSTEKTNFYFSELNMIYRVINQLYGYNRMRSARQFSHLLSEYERFGVAVEDYCIDLAALFGDQSSCLSHPSILYVISDLSPGGGQLIHIRLADAYIRDGGIAILLNLHMYATHPEVAKTIPSHVPLLNVNSWKPDTLPAFLQKMRVKIVHSSLWWADKFSYSCFVDHPFTLISSLHGCYESLVQNPDIDPGFSRLLPAIVSRFQGFIFTSDKHKSVLTDLGCIPSKETFILNGFEKQSPSADYFQLRKQLGVSPESKVLLIASRCVEGKGWDVAIKAMPIILDSTANVVLLLIGDGPMKSSMQILAKDLGIEKSVLFVGHTNRLADYIALADICLLPSTFVGESMPLVLIEYLAQSKFVIATNVGSIPLMLDTEDGSTAGILLDVAELNAPTLASAIRTALADSDARVQFQLKAERAFQKFDMVECVHRHLEFYRHCMRSCE